MPPKRARTSTAAARRKSSSRRPPRARTSRSCSASTTTATIRPSTTSSRTRRARRTVLATAVKPIVDELGWVKGFMTTIHSYTNDQNMLDAPHKDLRRARNAATNIIPTSTGAAKALYLTIPEVEGTFDGFALRVPTPTVSMIYLVAQTKKPDDQRRAQRDARARRRRRARASTCAYTEEELVSSDFKTQPAQLDHRRKADQRQRRSGADRARGTTTSGATRAVSPISPRWSSRRCPPRA